MVALIVVALVVDGVYVTLRLRSSQQAALEELEEARAAFDAEDFTSTAASLSKARDATSALVSLTGHPSFRIAARLPFIGGDARAIESLGRAADLSVRGGVLLVDALDAASDGDPGSLAESVYRDGTVQFAAIDRAAPLVEEAAALLARAESILEEAPDPKLGSVEEALEDARAEVSSASVSTRRVAALMDALPSLFGRDGVRRYFLAFQSPSEARGSGGFPGVFGILKAEEGRLSLGAVRPIGSLGLLNSPASVPGWYRDLYRDVGALRDPRQAGYSPNFPEVARVWLEVYEESTGNSLDGVMAMDPIVLSEMTRGTGPLTVDGFAGSIGPDNAVEALLYDSYVEFPDPDDQNLYLAALVDALWQRLGAGDVEVGPLAEGLGRATRGQHLKLYSVDDDVQAALADLGVDGDYAAVGPNVQLVYGNNAAANKVDYFLTRTIDTIVELESDGDARVTTRIELTNNVPADAPPSILFGPGVEGDRAGINGMVLYLLMPEGSRLTGSRVDGDPSEPLAGREGDHPVAYDLVEILPSETSIVEFTYLVPSAWDESDGTFAFDLFPQATAVPDRFSLEVRPPAGPALVRSGILDRTISVRATFGN